MSSAATRLGLRRAIGALAAVGAVAVTAVLLDSAIDFRPAGIPQSYRFTMPELDYDRPVILRRDKLAILVIRRSPRLLAELRRPDPGLRDPESRRSRQPPAAVNPWRSLHEPWFVAFALGTDYGCEITADADGLREICGDARYDFAGRAYAGRREFPNLTIPDYHFSTDFRYLVIEP